jgi:hypothetical protein
MENYQERNVGTLTLPNFINELREVKGIEWDDRWNGIRGVKGNKCFCPITALAYKKTKKYFWVSQAKKAAQEIGLSSDDAILAINASDGRNEYNIPLRDALIAACWL